MKHSAILTRSVSASVDEICSQIPAVAGKHQFGMLGEHNLQEKMASKGIAFAHACRVFEICNPQQAHTILMGNIAVSAALPCRISVYEQDGRTVLATIDPDVLLELFGAASDASAAVAADVRKGLLAILDELCADGGQAQGPKTKSDEI
jgi:uncharacterized protein (DUF302 family)